MLTNFQISKKTKAPACCSLSCCGNKFGRIERSEYRHDSRPNKIIKARRYAKHVEKQIIRREIQMQIEEDLQLMQDKIAEAEMKQIFADDRQIFEDYEYFRDLESERKKLEEYDLYNYCDDGY